MAKILKLNIEIADTPSKREMGLMYRKHLPENEGMLFKFPYASKLSFWMKNTNIPLEIAFIDEDGKIFQIEKMKPHCLDMISANKKCTMALEVNRGWFSDNGVGVGSKILNFSKDKDATKSGMKLAQNMDNSSENTNNQTNNVILDKTIEGQIKEAEKNGSAIIINYVTENGNSIPPRKLMPLNNKYEITYSRNGKILVAMDVSPNVEGGGMEITGGHVKTFLIKNIVGIQVLNNE